MLDKSLENHCLSIASLSSMFKHSYCLKYKWFFIHTVNIVSSILIKLRVVNNKWWLKELKSIMRSECWILTSSCHEVYPSSFMRIFQYPLQPKLHVRPFLLLEQILLDCDMQHSSQYSSLLPYAWKSKPISSPSCALQSCIQCQWSIGNMEPLFFGVFVVHPLSGLIIMKLTRIFFWLELA